MRVFNISVMTTTLDKDDGLATARWCGDTMIVRLDKSVTKDERTLQNVLRHELMHALAQLTVKLKEG